MTQAEFIKIMEPIPKQFGEKQYEHRMNLIFEHVADLPGWALSKIVRYFLETNKMHDPPMPVHFREQAIIQRKAMMRENPNWENQTDEPVRSGDTIEQILLKSGNKQAIEAAKKFRIIKNEEGA